MRTKAERMALHRNVLAVKKQQKQTTGANRTDIISDPGKKKIYLKIRVDGQELFVPASPEKE